MTNFDLGFEPHEFRVLLTREGDFRTTLSQKPETPGDDPPVWDPDTNITLKIGTESFSFTIDGTDANLVIDKADVNQLIEARVDRAWLYYNEGTADEVWAIGTVKSSG